MLFLQDIYHDLGVPRVQKSFIYKREAYFPHRNMTKQFAEILSYFRIGFPASFYAHA